MRTFERREEVVDDGLEAWPMEESNLHRPRPLGEVRRPSGPSMWGFWAAGRMA